MLGFCTKIKKKKKLPGFQVYSGFVGLWGAWIHIVCVYKANFLSSPPETRYSCSVFTALWCGCSVVKLTFYLHQTPSWLWLVTRSFVFWNFDIKLSISKQKEMFQMWVVYKQQKASWKVRTEQITTNCASKLLTWNRSLEGEIIVCRLLGHVVVCWMLWLHLGNSVKINLHADQKRKST